jgi:hypothetical protein
MQDALRAEHAAIFAYGVLGAHLPRGEQAAATEADRAHRDRRDAVATLLTARSVEPPVAEPNYALPGPVDSPADARRLAVTVEERVAAAWRAAVPTLAGPDRRLALDALIDCAVRAARWRQSVNPGSPPTVPFPGR